MKPLPQYVEIDGYAFVKTDNILQDIYYCPDLSLCLKIERRDGKLVVNNRFETMYQGETARVISERKFRKLNKDFL